MPPYAQLLHAGIYHTAAALARIGHNVVIDHVLYDAAEVPVMVTCWRALPVWLIGLHCPLDVLHARAIARPDQLKDWPEYVEVITWQFNEVHKHTRGIYDLEVDTSRLSAIECAFQIKDALHAQGQPRALKQITALV